MMKLRPMTLDDDNEEPRAQGSSVQTVTPTLAPDCGATCSLPQSGHATAMTNK